MLRHEFRAMGSKVIAVLDGEDVAPVLEDVPAWFENWEQTLSRFRLDSELSRLNASAGRRVEVSTTLWSVYQAAIRAEESSAGLVNALVLNAVVQAGYDRPFDQMQRGDVTASHLDNAWAFDWNQSYDLPTLLSLSDERRARTLQVPEGLGLDFGGIAKGWAAHQAMLRLALTGPALVSAGGDIAVSGTRSKDEPWPIDVDDPFHPGSFLQTIYLERGGVATSGKDRRRWMLGDVAQHHVIDPRTGQPAQTDILTATVIAADVMQAEAMAKAVMISGSEAGLEWLESDQDVEGLLVLDNGDQLYSSNFEKYL